MPRIHNNRFLQTLLANKGASEDAARLLDVIGPAKTRLASRSSRKNNR
jgi:hypothetical protein